ncbi:ChaN family lipoprotein [Stutzerimonas tarimensis]|uniref:ChaN family lipoprotein n=1 Tax=Stutzerimonas tarimensis TaxID=1507735 RepID=A0ABV7T2V0_9GAMM
MGYLLVPLLMLLSACASQPPLPEWQSPEGRDHADLGQILELRTGRSLTPEELVTDLAGQSRVLVGERHDNPDHHALQLWLLKAMAGHRDQGSLLLEMLDPVQQPLVQQVQHALGSDQPPADLQAALGWRAGWDWALYGPLVEYALGQPYPLLAANLDRDEIGAIYRGGTRLSGVHATAAPVVQTLTAQIRVSHCDMLPESQIPAMLSVQQQRDRRMAERLLEAPAPAMLLAGAFHARRDLGVPLHLKDLGRDDGGVVVMLAEVGQSVGAEQADYVWFTPAQPEQDHCARFREAKKDPAAPGRKP